MAVLIYYLFAIIHHLYDFLNIIKLLSIKVNYFSMLSLFASSNEYTFHSIAIKRLFSFSLDNFGNTSLGALGV